MRHLRLGASLYVPATRDDLVRLGSGALRSVIYCTEDAVAARDLECALANLRCALPLLPAAGPLRFIRPRNAAVLEALLVMPGIENIDGFVLPKVTRHTLPRYLGALAGDSRFDLMPTLETEEAFDARELRRLRALLLASAVAPRILTLRLGGNDLMRTLGVRRPRDGTIYETALGPLMAQVVATFRPAGFNLTAPVFEGLADAQLLRAEVERDLAFGFFGKAAVHPDQIPVIEAGYSVRGEDLEMARDLLERDAPAVFRMYDTMCEVATHSGWAETIVARAAVYGVVKAEPAKLTAVPR